MAQRDVETFERIVLPHLDDAYTLARYLLRDEHDAQDVVQDAVLRALRHFDGYRDGDARAWLLAIVRNCCRSAQAGSGGAVLLVVHESSLSEGEAARMKAQPDLAATPEEEALRKDDVSRVRSAIEAIPEPFREAVVLRDLEDLSYAEIAEVTGVPVGTVMSRLSRGRGMLAKELLPPAEAEEHTRSAK